MEFYQYVPPLIFAIFAYFIWDRLSKSDDFIDESMSKIQQEQKRAAQELQELAKQNIDDVNNEMFAYIDTFRDNFQDGISNILEEQKKLQTAINEANRTIAELSDERNRLIDEIRKKDAIISRKQNQIERLKNDT